MSLPSKLPDLKANIPTPQLEQAQREPAVAPVTPNNEEFTDTKLTYSLPDFGPRDLQEFLGSISTHSKGLAHSGKFRIRFSLPTGLTPEKLGHSKLDKYDTGSLVRDVALYIESAQLPNFNITATNHTIYGFPRWQPVSTAEDNVEFQIRLDNFMVQKRLFDAWFALIFNPETQNIEYSDNFVTTIYIDQLARDTNKVVYTVALYRAFPINMQQLDLNHQEQNNYHRLAVSFAFERWKPYFSEDTDILDQRTLKRTDRQSAVFSDSYEEKKPDRKDISVKQKKPSFGDKVRSIKGKVDKIIRTTKGLIGENQNVALRAWNKLDSLVTNSTGLSIQETINTVNGWQKDIESISNADMDKATKVLLLSGSAAILDLMAKMPKVPPEA